MKPQEDALNAPVDMVIGTPGRLLVHVEEGNLVYGDIKYVVSFSCLLSVGSESPTWACGSCHFLA